MKKDIYNRFLNSQSVSDLFAIGPTTKMLLFVLLSNFYGNKVQDIQIENYPTKIFLKKTEILFAFSNKDVPLHPVNKSLLPL